MTNFHDRAGVALVTGGTGGIGAAVSRLLVERGAKVCFTYRSDEDAATSLLTDLRAHQPGCTSIRVDLADAEALHAAVGRIAHDGGGLHTVVHAAGPHVPQRHLSQVPTDEMVRQLTIDGGGFFNLMHAAVPHLRESRGSVVVVTTAATTRYPKRDGLSSGPKGAVEALARAFASEEGRYGVRVNCVGPGMLTDGMAARLIESGDLDEAALSITMQNIPLRRFGRAIDIAEAALFLASDSAGFITGQKLDIDGGYGI